MNKEEILKKAQSRKPNQMDEMEMDIFQKRSYITIYLISYKNISIMITRYFL